MINYAYWLSNIPGIGIRTRNRLIGAAGSAREVYGLTEKQLLLIPGVEEKHAAGIMESKKRDYDTEYESMAERGIFVQRRTAISTTSHRDSGCTVQSVCKRDYSTGVE